MSAASWVVSSAWTGIEVTAFPRAISSRMRTSILTCRRRELHVLLFGSVTKTKRSCEELARKLLIFDYLSLCPGMVKLEDGRMIPSRRSFAAAPAAVAYIIKFMVDTWFTSDFHFRHFNIIRYCNRPFANTQEMDEVIADRMNSCIKPNDTLYFLGDFCLGKAEQVAAYRMRLECKTIHFIEGNHDRITRKLQHLFTSWSSLSEIHVGTQRFVLCHYAMRVWPHHARGAWQLYGHSHGNLPDEPLSLSMDVGVDTHDFRPWHFDEIQAVMRAKATTRALRSPTGNGLEPEPQQDADSEGCSSNSSLNR